MSLLDVFYSGLYHVAVAYPVRSIGNEPSLRTPIVNCSEALGDASGDGLMTPSDGSLDCNLLSLRLSEAHVFSW